MSDCVPHVLGDASHVQLPSPVRHVSCQDLGSGRIIMALFVCNRALPKDDRLLQHTWAVASLTVLSTRSSGTSMMSSNRLHKKELSSSNTTTHGVPPSDSSATKAYHVKIADSMPQETVCPKRPKTYHPKACT